MDGHRWNLLLLLSAALALCLPHSYVAQSQDDSTFEVGIETPSDRDSHITNVTGGHTSNEDGGGLQSLQPTKDLELVTFPPENVSTEPTTVEVSLSSTAPVTTTSTMTTTLPPPATTTVSEQVPESTSPPTTVPLSEKPPSSPTTNPPPPQPPSDISHSDNTNNKLTTIEEVIIDNITTTISSSSTSGSLPSKEPPGVDPTYPPGELEPLISISIFLIFILLALSSVLVYLMIRCRFRYLPESIAFVLIGFTVGLVYHLLKINHVAVLNYQEKFSPQSFFLLLLPPIIFESGYSLHKGNFFQNLGSIIVFAVIGTAISTFIVGGGLYGLSAMGLVYNLNAIQSFTFGALISAVDPVATLAIFHALDVNPTLNMLVFGESVLNDAVSIVMTKTILKQATSTASPGMVLLVSLGDFLLMFCVSAIIGILFALVSAIFLKFVNFREYYSLEFSMWFLFAFGPYFLAEGLHLSGIMAVLFCGIVMSHYTHYNLTPVTQVTVQQTMRTVSFLAETVVFLYIGMQVFTISTSFSFSLIIWSLILILIGRAANIFPLSFVVNRFRTVNISARMQFIMWFSGLRGAIAYALALNLSERHDFGNQELLSTIATTTLVVVLFTIVVFGGSTLPILKILSKGSAGSDLKLSKTEEQGSAVTPGVEEEEETGRQLPRGRLQWFLMLDYRYFKPFLVRKFTKQEVHEARIEMQRRTNEWYQGVRAVSSEEEMEEETSHTMLKMDDNLIRERRTTSTGSSSNSSLDGRTASPTHIQLA